MAQRRPVCASKYDLVIISCWLVSCVFGLACAETTRYRVLSYFFDGVPEPGSQAISVDEAVPSESADLVSPTETASVAVAEPIPEPGAIRRHPPYRDYRCTACHNMGTVGKLRTQEEGLCRQCHKDIPGSLTYVHGPVAVGDCLFCHHPHGGTFAFQLRMEPAATCLRCHDADEIAQGPHHGELHAKTCTDCHSGHGGSNRFFLKTVEQ